MILIVDVTSNDEATFLLSVYIPVWAAWALWADEIKVYLGIGYLAEWSENWLSF